MLRIGTQGLAGIARLTGSLGIGATGSPVPCKSLLQGHAAFEPDVAGAGLQDSAPTDPGISAVPVLTSTLRFRQFTGGSLSLVSLDLT